MIARTYRRAASTATRREKRGIGGDPATQNLSGLAFVEGDLHGLRRCSSLDAALALADAALSHDFANRRFTLAAAGSDAEFELQFLE